MSRIKKLATQTMVAVVASMGLMLSTGAVAHAADLGGVSVQQACSNQFPGTTAVVVQNNVYGWRCRIYWSGGPVYYSGIDLNRQCRAQYGAGASANYLNYNNPYSWRCYR